MNLIAKLFPNRFVRRSLASQLSGVFSIEPDPLRRAVEEAKERIASTPASELRELAMTPPEQRASLAYFEPMPPAQAEAAQKFCARIPIMGTIVRGDASCARIMGIDATGLDEVSAALRACAADPAVAEIQLDIDSPGGTATGIQEVADLIGALNETKPVRAKIHGLCASAAYWLVSKCAEITAEPSSLVGSLGVYSVIEDSSKAFEQDGIKVHVVSSGPQKGAGVPGTEVTSAQLKAAQVVVDDLAALFVVSVAVGRDMSKAEAKKLATGDVWIASKALDLGLIDALSEPNLEDQPIAREGGDTSAKADVQEDMMTEKDNSALAARVEALEAREQENKKTIDALTARAEKAEAKVVSFETAASKRDQETIDKAIEAHAKTGTFAPAERPSIEALAKKFVGDSEGFVAHLDARAKLQGYVVTPDPKGKHEEQNSKDSLEGFAGVGADGKIVMKDGTRVQAAS